MKVNSSLLMNIDTKYNKIGSLFIYTDYIFAVLSIRTSNLFIEGLVGNGIVGQSVIMHL